MTSIGLGNILFGSPHLPLCSFPLPPQIMMGLFSSTASSFSRAVKPRGSSVSENSHGEDKPPSDTEPDDTSILFVACFGLAVSHSHRKFIETKTKDLSSHP
jgi:hypothetical protein